MKYFRTLSVLALVIMLGGCASSPLRGTRLPELAANPEVVNESSNDSAPISAATPSKSAPNAVAAKPPAPVNKPEAPGATSRRGAYYMDDGPGTEPAPDHRTIPNALPRREPLLTRANRPYVVFGRSYQPMTALVPYRQRGFASWYGRKFHGQKTASGEVYDMYSMTAAHPTLPLPSYVKVTNTRSGEQVIVRVNDRGPFLNDRLIDLSYSAAAKLGYVNAGSTEVEVELISFQDTEPGNAVVMLAQGPAPAVKSTRTAVAANPTVAAASLPRSEEIREERLQVEITVKADETPAAPSTKSPPESSSIKPTAAAAKADQPIAARTYLQLGAFSAIESAESTRLKVRREFEWIKHPIEIVNESGLFKLRTGPFESRSDANAAAEKIRVATGSRPFTTAR